MDLLELLAGGMTVDDVLEDYPSLERDDVLAALEHCGHDVVPVICRLADEQNRVVVTKDSDPRDSQTLFGTPRRLLRIMTGNIGNLDLLALVDVHLSTIVAALDDHRCVELSRTHVTGR